MTRTVGTLREIWRYPVKSMGGERLDAAEIGTGGILGDRLWAVRDAEAGHIVGGKHFPELMKCQARFETPALPAGPPPDVTVELPDGLTISSRDPGVHAALSELLGRRVELCRLPPAAERAHFRAPRATRSGLRSIFGLADGEPLPDLSMMPVAKLAELSRYATPPGTYFDAYAIHLLTTSSLELLRREEPGVDFDVRRFRPNFLLDTGAGADLLEAGWSGGRLSLGVSVVVAVQVPTVRCSMPSRPQKDLPAEPRVMRTVARAAGRCLGAYGEVLHPGRVNAGDTVGLELVRPGVLARAVRAGGASVKRLVLRAGALVLPRE